MRKLVRVAVLAMLFIGALLMVDVEAAADNLGGDKAETLGRDLNSILSTGNYSEKEIEALVKAGADVNVRSPEGKTPLMYAIRNRGKSGWSPIREIKILIEAGADVNAISSEGKTALMYAIDSFIMFFGSEIISILVEAGADVNIGDPSSGFTPLTFVFFHSFYPRPADVQRVLRILVEAGADVNVKYPRGTRGETMLESAISDSDSEMIDLLVKAGANINTQDAAGGWPAVTYAAANNHLETVTALLRAGADINARDSRGFTPLMIVIEMNRNPMEAIRLLVDEGADVNAKDLKGLTPLMIAVNTDSSSITVEAARLLTGAGADVNARDTENRTALIHAFDPPQDFNSEVMKVLIEAGADVNAKDVKGRTPLAIAYENPWAFGPEVVDALANAGAEVKYYGSERNGYAELLECISNDDPEAIKKLIRAGLDITANPYSDGDSPLMYAIHRLRFDNPKSIEVIKILVDAGADVNTKDSRGRTPFTLAIQQLRFIPHEVIKILVNAGADINAKDSDGRTVLIQVLERPAECNPEVIKILIEAGADVNAKDTNGGTPLMIARSNEWFFAPEVIEILVNAGTEGADTATNNDGPGDDRAIALRNDLHRILSSENYSEKDIKALIKAGVDVNAKDSDGITPLELAYLNENFEAMRLLIKAGAEVNAKNPFGSTLLEISYDYGNNIDIELMRILVKAGANVNVKDSYGNTLLTYALNDSLDPKAIEAIRLLVEGGADVNAKDSNGNTPLELAYLNENFEAMRLLIEAGADVNARDDLMGHTPLMRVVQSNVPEAIEVIRLLVKAGADVNAKDSPRYGNTPLMFAMRNNAPGVIEAIMLLVEAGADVNIKDSDGDTPLMRAIRESSTPGAIEIIRLLVEAGADVNVKDSSGFTPLWRAYLGNGDYELIEFLINAGADLEMRIPETVIMSHGETVLMLAVRSDPKLVKLLVEAGADVKVKDSADKTLLEIVEKPETLEALLKSMGSDLAGDWLVWALGEMFEGNIGSPFLLVYFNDFLSKFPQIEEYLPEGSLASEKIGEAIAGIARYQIWNQANNLVAGTYLPTMGMFGEYDDVAKILPLVSAEPVEVAAAFAIRGEYYRTLGEHLKAKERCERALATLSRAPEGENAKILSNQILTLLTIIHSQLKDYEKAKEYGERVFAELAKMSKEDADNVITMGEVYFRLGDYGKAKEYLERGLALRQETEGGEGRDSATANILNVLGIVNIEIGDRAKAKECFESALMTQLKIARADHPDSAPILFMLGNHRNLLGLKNSAILFEKMAVNVIQSTREDITSLEEGLQKSYLKSKENFYNSLADLLIERGRIAEAQQVLAMLKEEEFFDFIQRGEQKDQRVTVASYSEREQKFIDRLQEIMGKIYLWQGIKGDLLQKKKSVSASAWELLGGEEQLAEANYNLHLYDEDLRAFFVALDEELNAGLDAERNPESIQDLKEVLKGTTPGTVFVHTLVTPGHVWLILTTSNDVSPPRKSPTPRPDLYKKIQGFRERLEKPNRGDPKPLARELYDILIAPISKDLQDSKAQTLLFSLDGALRFIPMSALHDGERWLAEKYAVAVYTDAARENLGNGHATGKWETAAAFGVTEAHPPDFIALPAVRAELESIVVKEGGGDADGIFPGTIHLDPDFTESAFAAALGSGAPIIHVATHFKLKPGTIADSFLLLGDGGGLTLKKIHDDDLNFKDVDQLTLSACETAIGFGESAGREMEGMGVLAQKQGAKSVMATLWSIADSSTGVFMPSYYELLQQEGMTKAEALRLAQVEFIKSTAKPTATGKSEKLGTVKGDGDEPAPTFYPGYSHPYYWAPFILMGNWL